jgi:hypothetical protein
MGYKSDKNLHRNSDPAAVKEAIDLIEEIERLIEEDVPERSKTDVAPDFFEGVLKRSKDIGETIESKQEVTPNQLAALNRMKAGVERWIP